MSENDGYEGVTHAGVALVARDTGEFLLAQRAFDESDDPDVQESWEFPGGGLEEGEDPQAGAFREFEEEIGFSIEGAEVVNGWRNGHYQGFVVAIDTAEGLSMGAYDLDEVAGVYWFTADALPEPIRPELAASMDWTLLKVSGNEDDMDDDTTIDEPEFDLLDFAAGPIPIHGVIAPEGTESGDMRGFTEGSMTTRPLRIPFRWQKTDIGGHDGAVTVGSVDRVMRKDGLIHWEGLLMASKEADELLELIQFFDNRYGVSVDGDRGALAEELSKRTGVTWFEAVRAAGLTAVAIPAFAEAYVSVGIHPDFPDDADEVMVAGALSRDLLAFKRGKGWVTDPKETRRLHNYWTQKGQPGYAKIRWGTPGDWTRAKALIGEKIAKNSPEKMKYLNQIISQWHYDALGYWPGDLDKPGNKTSAEAKAERATRASIEFDDEGTGWEAVLTSSANVRPPLEYFHRHPDTGPLSVTEPDANGFRRVFGYAAKWGVCHVGMSGRCVEPPRTFSDDYPDFHLGRTKTEAGVVPTGVLTYGVDHRDAETILSESAQQSYFDNTNNAWASVRVGEDDFGIWFSGVVLPDVPAEHLVKIEASGQVSGEWLRGAMRACLTVNIPGYPVAQASVEYDESGNVLALAASAFGQAEEGSPCEETHIDRLSALKSIYAADRLAEIKKNWGA